MSLANLLRIGQLKEHPADAGEIARLLAALMAHGYRPDTNRPGHHVTIIQTLTLTLGIDTRRVAVLDALRRKRNLSDYTGEDIDEASVAACIEAATRLLYEAGERLAP